jgi:hypothetical protein
MVDETHNALGTNGCRNQFGSILQSNVERDVDAETSNNGQNGRHSGLIYFAHHQSVD